MSAASYMDPVAHAAEAIARAAQRFGGPLAWLAEDFIEQALRIMVRDGGTARIGAPGSLADSLLREMLLEGLVCCDHSSGCWRITDLGRAGGSP